MSIFSVYVALLLIKSKQLMNYFIFNANERKREIFLEKIFMNNFLVLN